MGRSDSATVYRVEDGGDILIHSFSEKIVQLRSLVPFSSQSAVNLGKHVMAEKWITEAWEKKDEHGFKASRPEFVSISSYILRIRVRKPIRSLFDELFTQLFTSVWPELLIRPGSTGSCGDGFFKKMLWVDTRLVILHPIYVYLEEFRKPHNLTRRGTVYINKLYI